MKRSTASKARSLLGAQAYVARFTIDRQVALVRSMALGRLDKAGALAELASFTVDVPAMPPTEAVLKVLPKSSSNPGTQIRWGGTGTPLQAALHRQCPGCLGCFFTLNGCKES